MKVKVIDDSLQHSKSASLATRTYGSRQIRQTSSSSSETLGSQSPKVELGAEMKVVQQTEGRGKKRLQLKIVERVQQLKADRLLHVSATIHLSAHFPFLAYFLIFNVRSHSFRSLRIPCSRHSYRSPHSCVCRCRSCGGRWGSRCCRSGESTRGSLSGGRNSCGNSRRDSRSRANAFRETKGLHGKMQGQLFFNTIIKGNAKEAALQDRSKEMEDQQQ